MTATHSCRMILASKGGNPMKHSKLDAVIVAALLLAHVPGLAEEVMIESTPAALMLPAADADDDFSADDDESTPDTSAERL